MKNSLLFLCMLAMLAACQDNGLQAPPDEPTTEKSASKSPYAISEDEALKNLYDFMAGDDDIQSRGGHRVVKSIDPIKYRRSLTRGTSEIEDCDNVVYIANFENDQGYAILAADKRIGEDVLAITDAGFLPATTISEILEWGSADNIIVNEFPTDGPGFFTVPEYGDEIFMNPNTASLYIPEENDTLVGNVDLTGYTLHYVIPDSLRNPSEKQLSIDLIANKLCVDYAINKIEESNSGNNTGNLNYVDGEAPYSGYQSNTRLETIEGEWSAPMHVEPILKEYAAWHQGEPFNDLCPERRMCFFFGHKKRASAGCFPLAIAKLMTHFDPPTNFSVYGYIINWEELKQWKSNLSNAEANKSAAYLLRMIGEQCSSWYFYLGTFTFPWNATSFMRTVGFKNAHSDGYSFERVKTMLDDEKPVIIYGFPGIWINQAHSWNIDGYKIKERRVTKNRYVDDALAESKVYIQSCKMVHCDFGWGRNNNGYYVSGIFKLNDKSIEHDPYSEKKKDTNFNHYLKIITYDL